ncbi:hypothetical protein VPNG_04591 [Cytospora leucostoma]|uniref:AB hydrolase-1 domain-containing protein n=1 Tax=Cytospora leucostoma TaxID=1230097 RepID=A0A423XCN8_9PEZI|nr:hypothetical protein VPNG_04591 [Cytospora leucostoma]
MDSLTTRPLLGTAVICLSAAVVLWPLWHKSFSSKPPTVTPSPRETLLPYISKSEISALPYPPDALPGSRDVPTPYGTIKVFEFGPASGERVLLLPGLSTPCLALSNLARTLALKGYRVMLFDYFGRGWSDAPNPEVVKHDERLYASQIMLAVASSNVGWLGNAGRGNNAGFHIIGYSFGGGLAVNFAGCFPHLVRSVTAVAPSGLVKRSSNSWKTWLLYSKGLVPERLLQFLVRRRYEPVYMTAVKGAVDDASVVAQMVEPGPVSNLKLTGNPFDDTILSPDRPDVTVASVVSWQLHHHEGFIPAVMSAMRYGPIYERHEEWRRLGILLSGRRRDASLPGLFSGKILVVLGSSDMVVKAEQVLIDLEATLGKDAFEVELLDAAHEVAMAKGAEVANVVSDFWKRCVQDSPDVEL